MSYFKYIYDKLLDTFCSYFYNTRIYFLKTSYHLNCIVMFGGSFCHFAINLVDLSKFD